MQRLEQKNVKKFQMLTPPTAVTGMRLIPYPNAFVRAINEKGTPHVGLQLRLFHPLCFPRGWCARVLSMRSCLHREKNPLTQARNTRRPHWGAKMAALSVRLCRVEWSRITNAIALIINARAPKSLRRKAKMQEREVSQKSKRSKTRKQE